MATALSLRNNQNYRWRVEKTPEGLTGYQNYRVDTLDEAQALAAVGLPAAGSAWGTGLTNLKARRYVTYPEGISWTRVEVIYESDEKGGFKPSPAVGVKWTEIQGSADSVTVYTAPDGWRLNNGRGASKIVGRTNVEVHAYIADTAFNSTYWNLLVSLMGKVNSNAQSLPRLGGGPASATMNAGELLYIGHQPKLVAPGIMEVVHSLQAAPDFKVRWLLEDAGGNPIPGLQVADVQEAASFAGAW